MKKMFITVIFLFPLLILAINPSFAGHFNLTAQLTGAQENPAVITSASGTGAFTYSIANGLSFTITVNGLSGPVQASHFHYGNIGVNGPVVKDIIFTGNTAKGTWKSTDPQPLNDSLLAALILGKLYVNVHTAANPGGEIRGQVMLSSETALSAYMDGLQEVPSLVNNATGTASITLLSPGNIGLAYMITVDGLSGPITGAHFHYGKAGQNGGIVKDITSQFSGNSAMGLWRTDDPSQPLVDSLITALLTGNLYVNVHTSLNPGGEVRGQVYLSAGWGFTGQIDGAQEVPPVTTNAKGNGSYTLTEYGLVYYLTVEGLSGPIQAAHFHNAAAGINGPVVRTIPGFVNNSASGVWKPTDSEPLTNALFHDLLDGKIYVNVHTAANPGGEIRGQLNLNTETGFTANLDGEQENPPVTTNATGTGSFVLSPTGLNFNITVNGLSGAITGAHFHYGVIGQNGGIVKDITSNFIGNTASGIWMPGDPQPLNDSLINALLTGKLYVNVHTAANPGGEIRGQVILTTGSGMNSMIDGLQEVPSVTVNAKGTAAYTMTSMGLVYRLTASGLTGAIVGSHFHLGAMGMNGGIVKDITASFTGNTATGVWRMTGINPLVDSLLESVFKGDIYVNIHTAANPGGEIRGQVILSEGIGLASVIDGSQEVPPVTTSATGSGSYTLTFAGLAYHATVTDLSGPIVAAHFHNASAGINGPVVRTLNFINNSTSGIWRPQDGEPLTLMLTLEILANNVYINAHTAANPGGEIRGQLLIGPITVVSINQISSIVPEKFILEQNFPNPFNPDTEIRFSLPKNTNVKLKIYNLVGQEVAFLINDKMEAGSYSFKFKADGLASGVYFYKMESDGFSDVKKMILLR